MTKKRPASKKQSKKTPSRRPRQIEMPGTEDKDIPAPSRRLLDQLDEYLGVEDEHRSLGKRKRDQRDDLMATMVREGVPQLPYVDAVSGKKKLFVADTTPRAKKVNATDASEKRKGRRGREKDIEIDDEERLGDNVVESRTVSRESVEKEIDPFAAVRGDMSS